MGPNEVLKILVVGLATLTGAGAAILGYVTARHWEKVKKAEKVRFELMRLRAERESFEANKFYPEEHHETALTH